MSQHDMIVDNGPGLAVRTDINTAIQALASTSLGATAPTVPYAGQFWLDSSTTPPILKQRNTGNTGWVTLLQISSIDMGTGFRASPDRWVVNENAALTGRDYLSVLDGTGEVTIQDKLQMLEVDGSVRGLVQVGIGSDPGSMYNVVYDAAGTEVNRWWMLASGLHLSKGGYRFHTGTILRGQMIAEMAAGAGKITFQSNNSAGAIDGQMELGPLGSGLPLAGDFFIMRSAITRANFGWDASRGTYLKVRDAGGALVGQLDLRGLALALAGISGSVSEFRIEDAAQVKRGAVVVDIQATATDIDLVGYDNAGVAVSGVECDPAAAYVRTGATLSKIRTDLNIINQTAGQPVVDFPVGTYVLASTTTAGEPNRNTDMLIRLMSGSFAYQHSGGGSQLTGTWRARGTQTVTAGPVVLCQRVS